MGNLEIRAGMKIGSKTEELGRKAGVSEPVLLSFFKEKALLNSGYACRSLNSQDKFETGRNKMKRITSCMIAARDNLEDRKRKGSKKKISLLAASLVLLVVAVSGSASATEERAVTAESPDKGPVMKTPQGDAERAIAATVNGAPITRESVMAMMDRMSNRKGKGDLQTRYDDDLKQKALDRLIFQELAYQKAKEKGITADPKDVETALTNLKKKMGGEQEYDDFLKASALTEAGLRSQLERAIIVDHIFTKEVFEHAAITEDEVKKEYEKGKDTFVTPEKIVVY